MTTIETPYQRIVRRSTDGLIVGLDTAPTMWLARLMECEDTIYEIQMAYLKRTIATILPEDDYCAAFRAEFGHHRDGVDPDAFVREIRGDDDVHPDHRLLPTPRQS